MKRAGAEEAGQADEQAETQKVYSRNAANPLISGAGPGIEHKL